MITFDEDVCKQLDQALRREWLETNGIGGYSSSTIVGMNTRRYHGLLVASLKPPVDRYVLLSKLEETLVVDGESIDLSVNQYPGTIHPQGYRFLKSFHLDPFPIFTYEVNGVCVQKSLFLVQGENTVVVQYKVLNDQVRSRNLKLMVRPLIAYRDYHSTTHENGALNSLVEVGDREVFLQPYASIPGLHVAHNGTSVEESGIWYRNFEYEEERKRGLEFHEDLFQPIQLSFDLSQSGHAALIASIDVRNADIASTYEARERQRRKMIVDGIEDDFVRALTAAADQFIVSRDTFRTVIAGYHWFSDWGRDTMIALPGLALETCRFNAARSILEEFALLVDRGMLPNRFPDAGETPEYNTVDATLWYFEAIRQYTALTGDYEFVRRMLYPVLTGIIALHIAGTRFGIKVDEDGLLNCGEPGVQLTWMDAKIGDWVVTPRYGKPVEIQALWFNALKIMQNFAARFGDLAREHLYESLSRKTENSFKAAFWNQRAGCLFDVVGPDGPDASIRPNQVFAVSLHYSMLEREPGKQIIDILQRELLTPFGLRTLAPSDPQYTPRYRGDPYARDSAYHQGTVWPWLLGPFIEAYLRVSGDAEEAVAQARQWLEPMQLHLTDYGLGQVSEVCDAGPPYTPGGCIAQAWSVAQLLGAAKRLSKMTLETLTTT